jgi:hypothetical protein
MLASRVAEVFNVVKGDVGSKAGYEPMGIFDLLWIAKGDDLKIQSLMTLSEERQC